MVVLQHHGDHFRQPEDRPEKSLKTLLHPVRAEREEVAGREKYMTASAHMKCTVLAAHGCLTQTRTDKHTMCFDTVGVYEVAQMK